MRGGFQDIQGLKTVDADPAVRKRFEGDDDHPGYSDAQISEALVAREVDAIARSPYWNQSVIVITYDESGGSYDHVPPPIVENGPSRQALSTGPRIPLIIISPYAKAHAVSHELGQQASVIRMIDTLFGLPPLADLPDELAARVAGEAKLGQSNLGPADDMTPGVGDLLSAFDDNRLAGRTPPLARRLCGNSRRGRAGHAALRQRRLPRDRHGADGLRRGDQQSGARGLQPAPIHEPEPGEPGFALVSQLRSSSSLREAKRRSNPARCRERGGRVASLRSQ